MQLCPNTWMFSGLTPVCHWLVLVPPLHKLEAHGCLVLWRPFLLLKSSYQPELKQQTGPLVFTGYSKWVRTQTSPWRWMLQNPGPGVCSGMKGAGETQEEKVLFGWQDTSELICQATIDFQKEKQSLTLLGAWTTKTFRKQKPELW